MTLNFNRATLSGKPINQQLNELIEAAQPPSENVRQYLGASSIGSECLRKVQYDWFCDPVLPARTQDIFARGHFFEYTTRHHLVEAGFKFAPAKQLEFRSAGGLLRGHADGILTKGPQLPGLHFPCIWEHKAVKDKGWRTIERDGLTGLYAVYAGQVALYQSYLDITNPALFSVVNADTCERLHFLVPFDAQLAQLTSDRAVAVIEATRSGELLPRVTDDPKDWRCKMCSHQERCWRAPVAPAPEFQAPVSVPVPVDDDLSIPEFLRRSAPC
jgi:hypothetical protein